MPNDALEHCDAVVVGEAEGLWKEVIEDMRRGSLRQLYRHEQLPEFLTPTRARRSIFTSKKYVPLDVVQASRGCPFDCEFCSVTTFFGRPFRMRDVQDITDEIRGLDGRWIMFADDNIIDSPAHSRRLLEELRPLHLTWFGQASLHGLHKQETIRQLAAAGCKG